MLVNDPDLLGLLAQSDEVNGGRRRDRIVDFRHDYELLAREVQLLDSVPEHNLGLPV